MTEFVQGVAEVFILVVYFALPVILIYLMR